MIWLDEIIFRSGNFKLHDQGGYFVVCEAIGSVMEDDLWLKVSFDLIGECNLLTGTLKHTHL